MEKGKHALSKREQIKQRAKKQIAQRLIILVICLICIVILIQTQNENREVSASQDKSVEQQEAENQEQEENGENKENNADSSNEESKTETQEVPTTPTEDEEIKTLIAEIKTANNLTADNFAFFYYNPQTQKYYFDNQDKYFKGASTVKVPVAMIYYDKIRNGELTEESTLQYTSDDYEAGGGTTASKYKVGNYIPISFLLEQSIINSDNTAVNILIDGIGYRKCRELMAQYSDEEFIADFYTSNLTKASFGFDIINHIYQNQENYQELIGYMKQSSFGEYLKKYITEYDVAHKYGSYAGNVHDYGIVFADSPYLIGVYTQNVPNADELIANISRQVLDIKIDKNE